MPSLESTRAFADTLTIAGPLCRADDGLPLVRPRVLRLKGTDELSPGAT
jgi:hypothetical protein